MRAIPLALAGLLAGTPLWADGDALVIGNSRYNALRTFFGVARVSQAADALRERGFAVAELQDATADGMAAGFADFVAGLDPADGPVVAVLAGAFVHGHGGALLLPTSDEALPAAEILTEALPLDAILTVLAIYPGRALLLLGEAPDEAGTGLFLKSGIGTLDIPHGVTVLRGPAPDVARFAAQELAREDGKILQAARRFDLTVEGYAPGDLVLMPASAGGVPTPPPQPPANTAAEASSWRLAEQADTAQGYRTYLEGFADGAHAAAARQRLTAIEQEPFYRQRRAEEALDLSRDARREIQRDLSILGYNTRGIDGIFGPGTRGAVRSWQAGTDEAQSGYLDGAQVARLDAQAARRAIELEEEAQRKQQELEQADRAFWREVEGQGDEAGLRAYLDRYPEGLFAGQAREMLSVIVDRRARQAAGQDRRDWAAAREADSLAGYGLYLDAQPTGAFVEEARARITAIRREADMAQGAQRARAEEQALNLNPVARRLAEARMAQLGLKPGTVDGTFDQQTRAAIRRYQQARGLDVSGYLDDQTVVRILADGVLGRD